MSEKVILLVEDNPDDEELILRACERSRIAHRMVVARDGQAALDYFFGAAAAGYADAPQPRIVLLDLQLPKVGGLDVLRRLRADPRTRRIPVIMLASSEQEADFLESYDCGANSYILKPVDFAQLSERVRQIQSYWLEVNQLPPVGV